VVIYTSQILIVAVIAAFARKNTAKNREKMKQANVVAIDGRWNHQRNGWVHILDIVDVESRSVINFGIVQKANVSGRGSGQESSNGMEVEAMRGW
jgi:hypothetical protein